MPESLHPGIRLRKEVVEPSGLTISELARLAGVSRQSIHAVLNGKSQLSPRMIARLRKVLDINPSVIQRWLKDYDLSRASPTRHRSALTLGDPPLPSSLDVARWADAVEARHMLPRLARMLVRNAVPEASIGFPAGRDIQLAGWDGSVESPRHKSFVPAGVSVWEVSTDSQPAVKAEKDYQKRLKALAHAGDGSRVTYVALTARCWAGKKAWAAAKNKEQSFKRVCAYDAVDLEQWLEAAPDLAIWFAEQIGRRPRGIQSLAEFWEHFCASTYPPISPQLLSAGRDQQAEKVRDWLRFGTGVLRVLADSGDEALAFLAATIALAPKLHPDEALAQIVLVSDADHVRQMARSATRLILGWQLDDPSLLGMVVERGHRVYVPLGRSVSEGDRFDVQLSRPERSKFIEAIEAAFRTSSSKDDNSRRGPGDPREEASRRTRKCGRSITAYRRLFASAGLKRIPNWAQPENAADLVPFLLAGSWSETSEADRLALSELAGASYDELNRRLMRLRNQPDSPLRKIGDTWLLTAAMDSWSLLASSIGS